jgi:hypothetical protein
MSFVRMDWIIITYEAMLKKVFGFEVKSFEKSSNFLKT